MLDVPPDIHRRLSAGAQRGKIHLEGTEMPDEKDEESPLDFPMSLGALGDMPMWICPNGEGDADLILLRPPTRGMIESMVPLAEATINADLRRLTRDARKEVERRARAEEEERERKAAEEA
jgi:hypothetical protein